MFCSSHCRTLILTVLATPISWFLANPFSSWVVPFHPIPLIKCLAFTLHKRIDPPADFTTNCGSFSHQPVAILSSPSQMKISMFIPVDWQNMAIIVHVTHLYLKLQNIDLRVVVLSVTPTVYIGYVITRKRTQRKPAPQKIGAIMHRVKRQKLSSGRHCKGELCSKPRERGNAPSRIKTNRHNTDNSFHSYGLLSIFARLIIAIRQLAPPFTHMRNE